MYCVLTTERVRVHCSILDTHVVIIFVYLVTAHQMMATTNTYIYSRWSGLPTRNHRSRLQILLWSPTVLSLRKLMTMILTWCKKNTSLVVFLNNFPITFALWHGGWANCEVMGRRKQLEVPCLVITLTSRAIVMLTMEWPTMYGSCVNNAGFVNVLWYELWYCLAAVWSYMCTCA